VAGLACSLSGSPNLPLGPPPFFLAGEQGQDAGGVARDMLSTLTQQLASPAAGLFRPAGRGGRQLYPVPGACDAAQAKRYRLLGQVMAKVGRGLQGRTWACLLCAEGSCLSSAGRRPLNNFTSRSETNTPVSARACHLSPNIRH
jgi:hypothetical protein